MHQKLSDIFFEKYPACIVVLAYFFAVTTRRMRFFEEVASVSEHIDHLEVSTLRRNGEGSCVVREIGTVSDTGVFEAGSQFIQLVQYHYGDPHLVVPDRVQMCVARVDFWLGQEILHHRYIPVVDGDVERADTLENE